MTTLRYRHLELTELEIDGTLALPAVDSMPRLETRAASVLGWLGAAVLFLVRVLVFTLGLTVRIGWPIAVELVCIALAAVGMVGRALDHAGCAAARHSRVLCAVGEALGQLSPPRVERAHRTAIAVRVVR
jgi:hypothetical protein